MNTLTVVTICFNNLPDVQRSCASVDAQTVQPLEHWIINGSTRPEIAQWLESTAQPAYRKWLNERDKGISDAFNKGIERANGTIIHLLNAGDVYAADDVLETVINTFEQQPSIQWVSGKIRLKRAGHWIEIGKSFDAKQLYKGMRSVSHPTWFLKKEVYNRCGLFKSEYKIAMDYDLMCRIYKEPYSFIDKTLASFDDTGVSSTQYLASLKENIKVYESYFGFSLLCRLWQLRLKLLYLLLQTSLGKWLFRVKKQMKMENV
ncbi:MAG: glycosyltransferase [Bacteroidota bacterium]|nr:glycosyltransferase [Bacteroidota bacterium]